jgi:predicted Zn-ribbon and HTH transcriptional regulator
MSIGMERFASTGHFATYDPFAATASARVMVFQLQCRRCGFEPEDAVTAPKFCPKCHGESWERFARPGSILENANRY